MKAGPGMPQTTIQTHSYLTTKTDASGNYYAVGVYMSYIYAFLVKFFSRCPSVCCFLDAESFASLKILPKAHWQSPGLDWCGIFKTD